MTSNDDKIRVLVVDDSAFMRVALRKMMEKDQRIKVIDVAPNGKEAIEKIGQLKPDIVTMDIEMPIMDGLTALEKIMKEMPLPVIMISALTEEGADATFKALDLGAVDFIPKGGKSYVNLDIVKVSEQLRQKIHAIVMQQRLTKRFSHGIRPSQTIVAKKIVTETSPVKTRRSGKCQLVTIGTSTGGPMALGKLLPQLPEDFHSSILIVQHMPPTFTGQFAQRLNSLSKLNVKEAENGDVIEPGKVYLAPGGIHMKVKRESLSTNRIVLDPNPSELLFVPSVDVMMSSVADEIQMNKLGVIMTGMGSDGLLGMSDLKKKGSVTIAQDEASCVVYGMPRVCVERGIIDHVHSLDKLADEINYWAG